jgi:phosphoglucomutase
MITVNDKPREITHRIVPEGFSLDLCREKLEKAHRTDKAYQLGYVPDCDGDRGNLVYIDEGKAKILEAQEVFALSVLAELSYLKWSGIGSNKIAVAVNGPTSMRIDSIAAAFDAKIFRAEVGEANVVNLAIFLRKEGYTVRILGEGSNGGNITHPAAVRDPLNTVGAILKILSIKSENENPGLFEIWCKKSQQTEQYKENYTLSDIIKTLPPFTTTSAFEENALMKIQSESQGRLKANYENNFITQWNKNKDTLKNLLAIESWVEINHEGSESKEGIGPSFRSGAEKGGLKILFRDKEDNNVAYIWMRGSGTEPVFRVLADVQGDNRDGEQFLLNWQREMIRLADKN